MTQYYIGCKQISAEPMTRAEYNAYRDWELPANENGDDPGYLVEYLNSPNQNHKKHKGYISWSPEDVFESAYFLQGEDGTRITEEMVDRFIDHEESDRIGNQTVLHTVLVNGFTIITDSACVDPHNYDHDIGKQIAREKAKNKVWEMLGFMLCCAKNGMEF